MRRGMRLREIVLPSGWWSEEVNASNHRERVYHSREEVAQWKSKVLL